MPHKRKRPMSDDAADRAYIAILKWGEVVAATRLGAPSPNVLQGHVAQAIREAVAEEREACARVAAKKFPEGNADLAVWVAARIAIAIRARAKGD